MTPSPAAAAIPFPGPATRRTRRATLPRPICAMPNRQPGTDFSAARDELRGRIAYRAGLRRLGFALEDLLATTDLALCLALKAWRPERGDFKPFAWHYVKRETLRLLQRENRFNRARRDLEVFEVTYCPAIPPPALKATAVGCNDLDFDLARAHWLDGMSLRELSRTRGLSFRRVHSAIESTRAHLAHTSSQWQLLS